MEKKRLEEIKRVLYVVDVLNGFVRGGNLADSTVSYIIPEIVRLVEEIKNDTDSVVAFIKDSHQMGCKEFDTFPVHCLEGSWEAELVDELKPYENDALVYYKNSTSAMFAPGFMSDVDKMKNLREAIIVGLELDICDINLGIPLINYFNQNNRDVDVVVPMNAVETFDSPVHNREEYTNMAYKFMEQGGLKLVRKYEMRRDK